MCIRDRIFSTFFLARDLKQLQAWVKSIISASAVFHLKSAAENSSGTGRKYMLSYLLIYFITCIRQIIEPKLVSSTAKVHPLGMLCAIYFSLVSGSIWVLFYVMGLLILYSAFKETGALPSLTHNNKNTRSEF